MRKNKVEIIEKKFCGGTIYHLKLPKGFELSWAFFHKYFRQVDGDNDVEQKLINNFYKAFAELPYKYLEEAEQNLLELTKN